MNGEMIEIQLRKVNQVLSENRNKRGLKVVFIHGNGKGILRNEIIKFLEKNFPTLKFSDASMQKYGTGALEVIIRNQDVKQNNMKFKHSVPVQLRFNDTDALGHVNNSVYFTFYDLGKSEYFKAIRGEEVFKNINLLVTFIY